MEKKDVDRLFHLLAQYYPNAKQTRSEDTRLAWALALKRYRYEDMRAAAAAHAGKNKFFPDLVDLTSQCAPEPEEDGGSPWISPGLIAHVREMEALAPELREMERLMELDYRQAGVPHPSEARKMGWKPGYWVRVCKASLAAYNEP